MTHDPRIREASGSTSTLQHGLWGRGGQHGAVDQVCSEGLEGDVVRSPKAVPGLVRHVVTPRWWIWKWGMWHDVTNDIQENFAIFHGFHGHFCGKMMIINRSRKKISGFMGYWCIFSGNLRWRLYDILDRPLVHWTLDVGCCTTFVTLW